MHFDTVWVYSSFSVSLPPEQTPIFMLILRPDTHKIPKEDNTPRSNIWENSNTHTNTTLLVLAAVVRVTVFVEINASFKGFNEEHDLTG